MACAVAHPAAAAEPPAQAASAPEASSAPAPARPASSASEPAEKWDGLDRRIIDKASQRSAQSNKRPVFAAERR